MRTMRQGIGEKREKKRQAAIQVSCLRFSRTIKAKTKASPKKALARACIREADGPSVGEEIQNGREAGAKIF